MKPVELQLPPDASVVYNSLFDTREADYLTQDILLVSIGDVSIDVGWYPEGDVSGAYRVCVYEGSWENQLQTPVRLLHALEVSELVGRLAFDYASRRRPQNVAS